MSRHSPQKANEPEPQSFMPPSSLVILPQPTAPLTTQQKKSMLQAIKNTFESLPSKLKWNAIADSTKQKIQSLRTTHDAVAFVKTIVSDLKQRNLISKEKALLLLQFLVGVLILVYTYDGNRNEDVKLPNYKETLANFIHVNETVHDTRCPTQRHTENYMQWIEHDSIQRLNVIKGIYGLTRVRWYDTNHCPSKLIYLFHDVHIRGFCSRFGDSATVTDFFEDLLKRSPYVIDFIVETPETRNLNFKSDPFMDKIILPTLVETRNRFWGCFTRNAREQGKCVIRDHDNRIRFHFNDFRLQKNQWYGMLFSHIGLLRTKLTKGTLHKQREKVDHAITQLNTYFTQRPSQLDKLIRADFKVDRQLEHCSSRVRSIINDWLNEKIASPKFHQLHELVLELKRGKLDDNIQEIYKHMTDLGVYYMDAYTVARMFRTFTPRYSGEYSQPMRNIFVYAGDAHIEHYIDLLTRLGGYTDLSIQSPHTLKNQCIDVSNMGGWELLNTNIN